MNRDFFAVFTIVIRYQNVNAERNMNKGHIHKDTYYV